MLVKTSLTLGVLLLCAGTLLGIPHGRSKRRSDERRTELWRIAHLSTCLGGIAVIALALAMRELIGDHAGLPVALFTASAWLFFVACSLSGALNASWDGDDAGPAVKVVYGLQMTASALATAAVGVTLLYIGWFGS